ncbi:gamma-aminobutyric acid type B receptor subunit 2 [Lutzomyia longipalpis]|uniref:gamma-aminobutyric acid type B receptor subunit 2 n=1 Tax=Lutzomyia longipalpis TaxID=7200 RepID=UPI0024834B35|nr:gamma-aminobutyric acid type B receptor subunit 2 [Lutzomyia longipalpis]XP_055685136.1 gamma-aminobutyric acid type B receptor subunit 2 [Lutzomyia longipalpis]
MGRSECELGRLCGRFLTESIVILLTVTLVHDFVSAASTQLGVNWTRRHPLSEVISTSEVHPMSEEVNVSSSTSPSLDSQTHGSAISGETFPVRSTESNEIANGGRYSHSDGDFWNVFGFRNRSIGGRANYLQISGYPDRIFLCKLHLRGRVVLFRRSCLRRVDHCDPFTLRDWMWLPVAEYIICPKKGNWMLRKGTVQRFHKRGSFASSATLSPNSTTISSRRHVNSVFEESRAEQTGRSSTGDNGKVSLLGLFELSTRTGTRPEGHSELAAAQMAIRHINKRGLLPGYELELLANDTKCDPGVGVDRFFHALYTQHSTRMVMLLGSACSEVTESLAKVVPYWNIVQVSFGSTSPALSDRREFPLFYRTVAPDSSHNPARIAFIRRFGWDTVTTFSQNEEIHSLAVNDLVTELETANISCAATITFAETDFKDQLRMLRDLDTRIIIGSFSNELAPKIFCEAYRLGMYGADYAWILHETLGPPWWLLHSPAAECQQKQLEAAVESLIIVSSHNSIVGNSVSFSGLTNRMFMDELMALKVPQPTSRYAPQTYDAVWAIALALRGAEERWRNESIQSKLDGFDYTRYDMATEFLNQFSRLQFLGVSGPVSFSGADRVGTSAFYQIQRGKLNPVALYYPSEQHLDFKCPECVAVQWQSGQVPIAKRVFKLRIATIAPVAFYTMTSLASVGVTLALAFLAFNLHFRKLKAIKLSSPKLSNITAVGCILVYTAVILLGLDYSTLPATEVAFSTVCTARVYLLSAGFSLAFGSMFAKTYRVHRIFTRSGGSVCKDKMLQDTQLISLVCALLLLDGLVVTLWIVTDPMERHLNNLSLEISSIDRSVVYQPQVEVCRSQHSSSWLGALYAYKGLLLVVGVYMAWETRHVKISALNDSQYIGVSVYSVVITSAIVVVLANLISERVTLAFITIAALILTSTTATLCLLFLPKLYDIWNHGDDVADPIGRSMGLKMEFNTRRFVMDDRRELQYRVEVQNRVYRKEVAALDAEIQKLEKLLESTSSSTSSNISLSRHIKTELSIVNEGATPPKPRTPSIGGGLPLLLLSVLPPVIPRASWPSADHMQAPMRRSVTFSSQPQLDEPCGSTTIRLPAIDLLNLRLTHQQATAERSGWLNRIRGLFLSSRPSSRKTSTVSISGAAAGGAAGSGIAAALKAHMGLLSGLVPSGVGTSSCHALNTAGSGFKAMRRTSLARSGGSLHTSHADMGEAPYMRPRHRKFTPPAFIISGSVLFDNQTPPPELEEIHGSEPRVNFQLPSGRRPSIVHQSSQPTLRERVKGSPRFPHRIIPTSSLSALQESNGGNLADSQHHQAKWKSMEESTFNYTANSNHASIRPLTFLPTTHGVSEGSSLADGETSGGGDGVVDNCPQNQSVVEEEVAAI